MGEQQISDFYLYDDCTSGRIVNVKEALKALEIIVTKYGESDETKTLLDFINNVFE